MINVNLIGGGFHHDFTSTAAKKSKYITYDKNVIKNPITFYVDGGIYHGIEKKYSIEKCRVAWLNESKVIFDYENFLQNPNLLINNFDIILTYDDRFLKHSDKFKFMNPDGFWIKSPKICEKSKLVSMITSNKQMCSGHRYRLEIANKLKNKLDLFGRGINNITLKEEGLNDYAFSIAMENDMVDSYFTEKILDCFATGTIPIYHGTKKISNYFNTDGIIFLDELNMDDLNVDLYYSKLDAVKENFEKVLSMEVSEDNIYLKYLIGK